MFRNQLIAKVAATLVVVGGLALTQLSAPAAMAAPPSTVDPAASPYPPRAVTTTDLRLEKNRMRAGESNTAYVTVSSDSGTPQGRVTFQVSGYQPVTRPLVNGEASYELPGDLEGGRTYQVTARYNGQPIYRPSRDSERLVVQRDGSVAGEEGERGSGQGANRPGADGGDAGPATQEGALPSVGAEAGTSVYALAGLGLLGAGAAALLLHRRRRLES
jgi:LPXTG-motif cell wall-anchored protein